MFATRVMRTRSQANTCKTQQLARLPDVRSYSPAHNHPLSCVRSVTVMNSFSRSRCAFIYFRTATETLTILRSLHTLPGSEPLLKLVPFLYETSVVSVFFLLPEIRNLLIGFIQYSKYLSFLVGTPPSRCLSHQQGNSEHVKCSDFIIIGWPLVTAEAA